VRRVSQPPVSQLFAEASSAVEFGAFLMCLPALSCTPPGHGEPVLILPPFTTDDTMTAPMRWFLSSRGFNAHAWLLGRNLMRTPRLVQGVPRRLAELHEQYAEPVSLVGWSAGGMWARHLARDHPEMVRQVITLGTPFRLRPGDRTNASALYDMIEHTQVPLPHHLQVDDAEQPPLPVPVTAIYTRDDGVACWQDCLETTGPLRENVEVRGSHSGLGHNVAALLVVIDRLARARSAWQPFRPTPVSRHLFPEATSWERDGPRAERGRRRGPERSTIH
jgi:pimeloyl-ACP methyl ester carboxylesterase